MTSFDDALADALRGEHAAIYAYGVLGPHLTGAVQALAEENELAHRNLRDSMIETLPSPPPAAAFYSLPFPVTDAKSAISLAVTVESRCALLWRAVVVAAPPGDREEPLATLTAAAVRAAALRRAGGAIPGTVAFPGLTA
jgi:hypothetical protein